MTARAAAAAATKRRIVDAAIEHFSERLYDEVSLNDIAASAEVTVQTVLRKFGSKEGLVAAATEVGTEHVLSQRGEAPVGDVEGAIRNLLEHYEEWGERSLLFLAQEQRVESVATVVEGGRQLHYEWVERVFAPWLETLDGEAHERFRARLIAATDVYVWKIMRRDLGLDAETTEMAMRELVDAIVTAGRP